MNIFLIGPMGAGKTTVGKIVAKHRGLSFLDTDEEIVKRTGADIGWIFELEGEEGFRRREEEMLEEISKFKAHVFATGGGIVESTKNRAVLASQGFVVYLATPVSIQALRVAHDTHRPLLDGVENPADVLQKLQDKREPFYREVTDITVGVSGKDSKSVAMEVLDKLPS